MKRLKLWLPILLLIMMMATGFGCQSSQKATSEGDKGLSFFVANGSENLLNRLKEHHFNFTSIDINSKTGQVIKALSGVESDEFFIVINPVVKRPLAVWSVDKETDWATVDTALSKIEKINEDGPKNLARLEPSKKGTVKLTVFSDYQCPHCKRMDEVMRDWSKRYGETLDVEFINFPLPGHPEAKPAAQAAECAEAQNKGEEFGEKLFNKQEKLSLATYFDIAKSLKLDTKAFKVCMETGASILSVETDMSFGNFMVIRGTPSLFLNGKPVEGSQPEIESQIDAAINDAKADKS